MYVRANYKKIDDLGSYLIDKSDDIDSLNEDIKELLEKLNYSWNGVDYENFKNSYLSNIRKSDVASIELNALGSALKKVGEVYMGHDKSFKDKMDKMRKDDYERKYTI